MPPHEETESLVDEMFEGDEMPPHEETEQQPDC